MVAPSSVIMQESSTPVALQETCVVPGAGSRVGLAVMEFESAPQLEPSRHRDCGAARILTRDPRGADRDRIIPSNSVGSLISEACTGLEHYAKSISENVRACGATRGYRRIRYGRGRRHGRVSRRAGARKRSALA